MPTNLPFNPRGNIFRWGPIPGRFLYASIFVCVNFRDFYARFKARWAETLFLFREGRMLWLNDHNDLRASGLPVFLKYLLPREPRLALYQEWRQTVERLQARQRRLDQTNLGSLTAAELKQEWQKFHNLYLQFWITSTVPELANYGADKYFEDELMTIIGHGPEFTAALEVLTAPTQPSFYQEEEMALALAADLSAHQRRYFWLKNSYAGTEVLPEEFFAERKRELEANLPKLVADKLVQMKERKQALRRQYNLPSKIMALAEAISDGLAWQDERKKYIFQVLHYQDLMLQEAARRSGYDFGDLHNLWFSEVDGVIAGQKVDQVLERRRPGFGIRFHEQCQELTAEETKFFWEIYGQEPAAGDAKQFSGVVASRGKGKVTGRVRILLDPKNSAVFQPGEILVAPMTSPEYIFAMKKASAIVTDTGGLMSHAAIVSRELGIPCIVGTKVATAALTDGDVVTVNAAEGIVTKAE